MWLQHTSFRQTLWLPLEIVNWTLVLI
jgi:hypothetical protein